MRQPSKPSTAQCNSSLYTLFLLSEPKYVSCVRLSEILEPLSHDSVNRFLLRERYTPRDLFDEVQGNLDWAAGWKTNRTERRVKVRLSIISGQATISVV